MIQRLIHTIFGHSPVIRVSEIRANPEAQREDFPNHEMFYIQKFGATTITMLCPCGRGVQQVLLGKQIPNGIVAAEIEELKRMAKL